jgi:large subunit ribosomal protein L9
MKVILRKEVKGLGHRGEVYQVADGHGRNYLIPNNLALEANDKNLKLIEQEKRMGEVAAAKAKESASELAGKISGICCTIPMKAGEEDKLFGSVTAINIAESLKAEGIEIDRHQVIMETPIKSLGDHEVEIRIFQEMTVKLKLKVVKE